MRLEHFLDERFDPRSRPSMRTARSWCEHNQLPARKVGRNWFVDLEAFDAGSDDEIVNRILSA